MIDDISLDRLNMQEGARYLGYGTDTPDNNVMKLIKECEEDILRTAKPRYIYKVLNISGRDDGIYIEGTNLILLGKSIREHLEGCGSIVLLCATLSSDMDKLIRITQIKDMAKAVIMDAFAGVAVEQLCDKAEEKIKEEFNDKYFTYRFGFGYGDLPIEQMPECLNILNAQKTVGVSVTEGGMMSPSKSVACIIGISNNEIKSRKKGCITCNMRDKCSFRIRGERCGF